MLKHADFDRSQALPDGKLGTEHNGDHEENVSTFYQFFFGMKMCNHEKFEEITQETADFSQK